jgi:hypothetical protein
MSGRGALPTFDFSPRPAPGPPLDFAAAALTKSLASESQGVRPCEPSLWVGEPGPAQLLPSRLMEPQTSGYLQPLREDDHQTIPRFGYSILT